jgi:phage-related protein
MVPYTMNPGLKRLPAYFYRSDGGREPVREWLKGLEPADRKVIGEDVKDVEFSWPLGMPLVRSLGRELWEVRSSLPHGRIARIIFCVADGRMVLLHGFIKKTQKTPRRDIDMALKRKKGGAREKEKHRIVL